MSESRTVAVVGLPGTGKTTYLAALYNSLESGALAHIARLRKLPEQRGYLESIRSQWLGGASVSRTPLGGGEVARLQLETARGDLDLTMPDVSGESFQEALRTRVMEDSLVELLRTADGLIVFLMGPDLRHRVLLNKLTSLGLDALDRTSSSSQQPAAEFDINSMPTQVQIVELIQAIEFIRPQRADPLRLSIVISAWDEVSDFASPANWMDQMPMLRQFLESGSERLASKLFGVSAQGGSYGGDRPLEAENPSERAYVVTSDNEKSWDVSVPMLWAAQS